MLLPQGFARPRHCRGDKQNDKQNDHYSKKDSKKKMVQRMDASSPIKNGADAQRAAIAAQLAQLKEQRQILSKRGRLADTPQLAKRLRLLDDQIQAHADSLP